MATGAGCCAAAKALDEAIGNALIDQPTTELLVDILCGAVTRDVSVANTDILDWDGVLRIARQRALRLIDDHYDRLIAFARRGGNDGGPA